MKKRRLDYRRLWQFIKPSLRSQRGIVLLFLVFAVITALVSIAEPYLYGSIIDQIISALSDQTSVKAGFEAIKLFLIIWIVIVVVRSLLAAFISLMAAFVSMKALEHFLAATYERIMKFDVERFEREKAGEILKRSGHAQDALWSIVFFVLYDVVGAWTVFCFALVAGLIIDWHLALISLLPVPIVIGVGWWNMKLRERSQQIEHKYWEKIDGHIGDSFANIFTVKSFTAEKRSLRKVISLYKTAFRHQFKVSRGWAATDALQNGVWIGGRLLIFTSGVWLVLSGATSVGTLIMFLGFTTFFFGSVQQIMHRLPQVSRELTRLDRFERFLSAQPKIQDQTKARALKKPQGQINFEHVSFAYSNRDRQVLTNIDFEVKPGQTVALVGASGAGKTTIAKMMLRFYDPTRGKIKIDNIDIRDYTIKSLRQNIGLVMQDNLLFHTSILDNIRYAKPGAKRRDIIAAARRAQAHEFISKLTKDYNTIVGERGVKLSGGEKQRIAIARVLLENAPILVLDEATSALDSKTEHELQEALDEVMRDRTTIVIAHRLSTVMKADNILVIDRGKIIDTGRHQDLIKRGGLYKKYWQIQAGNYLS